MKTLVLLVAILMLAAGSAGADPLRDFVHAAGVPDDIDIRVTEGETINGYFVPAGAYCMLWFCQEVPTTLMLIVPPDTPLWEQLAILAHESGHYHQWLEGWYNPGNDIEAEWDADVRGVGYLCAQGHNGPEIAARLLNLAWRRFGNVYSDSHGSLVHRVERAYSLRCRPGSAGPEAP